MENLIEVDGNSNQSSKSSRRPDTSTANASAMISDEQEQDLRSVVIDNKVLVVGLSLYLDVNTLRRRHDLSISIPTMIFHC